MGIQIELQALSEDKLRKRIIIPLMHVLGCDSVHDNHGGSEKGKDVIYRIDHLLKKKVYGAVIVKNKKTLGKPDFENITRQALEALAEFQEPSEPRNKIRAHELVVMTSFEITLPAKEYIYDNCGRFFPNIHYVDGNEMERIINDLIAEYNRKEPMSYAFTIESFHAFCERKCGKSISISQRSGVGLEKDSSGRTPMDNGI